jgi:hypothetical protein
LAATLSTGCVGGDAPSDAYAMPGQRPEVVSTSTHESAAPPPRAGSKASRSPLVDGASWVYQHTNLVDAAWEEAATLTASTYARADALVLT